MHNVRLPGLALLLPLMLVMGCFTPNPTFELTTDSNGGGGTIAASSGGSSSSGEPNPTSTTTRRLQAA